MVGDFFLDVDAQTPGDPPAELVAPDPHAL